MYVCARVHVCVYGCVRMCLCVFVCGRYVEDDLVDFCIKHGIVVQAASPMGQYRFDRVSLSLV